jgi:hypothetical protein
MVGDTLFYCLIIEKMLKVVTKKISRITKQTIGFVAVVTKEVWSTGQERVKFTN